MEKFDGSLLLVDDNEQFLEKPVDLAVLLEKKSQNEVKKIIKSKSW